MRPIDGLTWPREKPPPFSPQIQQFAGVAVDRRFAYPDRMRKGLIGAVAGLLMATAACSGATNTPGVAEVAPSGVPSGPGEESLPQLTPDMVATGGDLYAQHCSTCHGADLKGANDWKVRNADGSYPPPPQDDTGHTWHHGDDQLVEIILKGLDFEQSRMPAFGDRLTKSEVLSILEFFKSTWGPRERVVQWEATLRERG